MSRWRVTYEVEWKVTDSGHIRWRLVDPHSGGSVDYETHMSTDRASAIDEVVAAIREDLLIVAPAE